jgi:hypothetical protein
METVGGWIYDELLLGALYPRLSLRDFKHSCKMCERRFVKKETLKVHVNGHGSDSQKLEYVDCGASFRDEREL